MLRGPFYEECAAPAPALAACFLILRALPNIDGALSSRPGHEGGASFIA
jgi:hypothetical protein